MTAPGNEQAPQAGPESGIPQPPAEVLEEAALSDAPPEEEVPPSPS